MPRYINIALITVLLFTFSCVGSDNKNGTVSNSTYLFSYKSDPQWQLYENEDATYRTAEYNAQWGLDDINAANAYTILEKNGKTIAGSGVKISIVGVANFFRTVFYKQQLNKSCPKIKKQLSFRI